MERALHAPDRAPLLLLMHSAAGFLSPISSIFNQFLAGAALSDVQRAGESRGALIECVYVEVDASRGSG